MTVLGNQSSVIFGSQTTQPDPATPFAFAADQNPATVYLARLAPGSRPTMRAALETIARLVSSGTHDATALPWGALRYQHTMAIRAALSDRYSPATANRHLAALRGVLKEAWRLGHLTAEEYQRAADLGPVRGSTVAKGRALGGDELMNLLAACAADDGPAGSRDAALIATLYASGLRRAEVVAIDLSDLDLPEARLLVRSGKGNKGRLVYVEAAVGQLSGWLTVRGDHAGALFVPIHRSGRLTWRRMTPEAVLAIMRKRAITAGLAHFSPHDLRRTFISDLLDAGADLSTVQALAGHSTPKTTARYDRRGERAKRRAAGLLSL